MSDTIGEVSINLRMSLVNFKKDVQDGTDAAKRSTKDLSDSVKVNISEARGTLSLLGEEVGVHLPRHLQTAIASIPGVGAALEAAFSSVAVLALIEVVVKVTEKIAEWKKSLEESKLAWDKVDDAGKNALHSQEEELNRLQTKLNELSGDSIAALRGQLRDIDSITLDHIIAQFKELQKSVDEAIDKTKVSGFFAFFGVGNNDALDSAKKDFDYLIKKTNELALAGKNADIGTLLEQKASELKSFKDVAFANDDHPEVRRDALNREYNAVLNLQKQYANLNKERNDKTAIVSIEDQNKQLAAAEAEVQARQRETQEISALRAATLALTQGTQSETEKTIAKIDAEIEKWREKKATIEAAYPGIKTYYDYEINALETAKATQEEILATQQKMLAAGIVPGLGPQKAPNLNGNDQKGIYGGTKEAEQLYKTQTDANTSVAEAQKIYTQTRTASEQLAQETAIYNTLLAEGKIDQDTYNRAMAQAKSQLDLNTIAYEQLGQDIGKDITQAALFGQSWTDAFKNILVQLVQVIIKMEALKALQSAGVTGNGGFGGGFFGSLLSGLLGGGKASGGPVQKGMVYPVGENGPELFAPGVSGTIIPNGVSGGGNAQVIYQIDARGADIGVEQRIRAAMKETENKAVARAVVATQEIQKRRV